MICVFDKNSNWISLCLIKLLKLIKICHRYSRLYIDYIFVYTHNNFYFFQLFQKLLHNESHCRRTNTEKKQQNLIYSIIPRQQQQQMNKL